MPRIVLQAVVCFVVATAALAQTHVTPGRVGMVMVGKASDGFALATDSASTNADGTLSNAQKLLPAGKNGVVLFAGAVSIQDPVGRPVREEVNVARIASAWLDSHRDTTIQSAETEINAAVSQAVTKFFSTRDPGAESGRYKFAIVFAGYADGKPVVSITRYVIPAAKSKAPRAVHASYQAKAGDAWILGGSRQNWKVTGSSIQELLGSFDSILKTAEEHSSKTARGPLAVIPPNRFATITLKEGFAVVNR